MLYAIQYHLNDLKNVKSTHDGALLLVNFQSEANGAKNFNMDEINNIVFKCSIYSIILPANTAKLQDYLCSITKSLYICQMKSLVKAICFKLPPTQKQPPEVFCKKCVLKHFTKFKGKQLCQILLSLRKRATLLKKRLWYRCFPVNFAK